MLEKPVYPIATSIIGRDNVMGAENQQERLRPHQVGLLSLCADAVGTHRTTQDRNDPRATSTAS
jgi:hypothetical protein